MSNKTANFAELIRAAKGTVTKSIVNNIPEIEYGRIKRELLASNPNVSEADVDLAIQEATSEGEANLLLFQTQYGKLSIASHLSFPLAFNMTANTPEARGRTHVVRPFWLGKGNSIKFADFKYKEAKSEEEIEKFISSTLVNQVVEMAVMYAYNPETTPGVKQVHAKETGQEVERRWYRNQFGENFKRSKYTYSLITNLADWINEKCPDFWEFVRIPEAAEYYQWTGTILLDSEYKEIIRKLKNKDYVVPAQVAKLLENNESELIKKTSSTLSEQLALLQAKQASLEAQLAEKDRLLSEKENKNNKTKKEES